MKNGRTGKFKRVGIAIAIAVMPSSAANWYDNAGIITNDGTALVKGSLTVNGGVGIARNVSGQEGLVVTQQHATGGSIVDFREVTNGNTSSRMTLRRDGSLKLVPELMPLVLPNPQTVPPTVLKTQQAFMVMNTPGSTVEAFLNRYFTGYIYQDLAGGNNVFPRLVFGADGEHLFLGTRKAFSVNLSTNDKMRMTVDANGYVGIGTASPFARLDLNHAVSPGKEEMVRLSANGNKMFVFQATDADAATSAGYLAMYQKGVTAPIIQFDARPNADKPSFFKIGGNFGIGTDVPQAVFHVKRDGVSGPSLAVIQGNAGGDAPLTALTLSHCNTPNSGNLNQSVSLDFAMEGVANGQQHVAGKIKVGKEADFVGSMTNVDSYMAFNTTQNGVSAERMRIQSDGTISVSGQIQAASVKTRVWSIAPDYVFEKGYKLASLEHVERFVNENKHLPEVPSAREIGKSGIDLAEMNMKLLKKVEELTLHAIRQEKEMKSLAAKVRTLERAR